MRAQYMWPNTIYRNRPHAYHAFAQSGGMMPLLAAACWLSHILRLCSRWYSLRVEMGRKIGARHRLLVAVGLCAAAALSAIHKDSPPGGVH
eukprot:4635881-Amphidinium_carterae.1